MDKDISNELLSVMGVVTVRRMMDSEVIVNIMVKGITKISSRIRQAKREQAVRRSTDSDNGISEVD